MFYARNPGSQMLLMEVFGGEEGVTKIAVQMRLPCGKNADLVTGIDLTQPDAQARLRADVNKYKPLVLIGAPPCTALGKLAQINKTKNPEAYRKVLHTGLILAKFMGELCELQLDNGRYFLVENQKEVTFLSLCASKDWHAKEEDDLFTRPSSPNAG